MVKEAFLGWTQSYEQSMDTDTFDMAGGGGCSMKFTQPSPSAPLEFSLGGALEASILLLVQLLTWPHLTLPPHVSTV